MNLKPVATLAVASLMTGLAPEVAAAQDSASPAAGWTGWVGCWELLQDDMRATSGLVPGGTPRRPSRAVSDMRVCVLPDGPDAAVKMTTWAADRVVLEQRILADGSQQPFEEKDCRGWQRSEWSATHRQLFTHAELECSNQPRRIVSGVTLMAAGPTWVDIQALEVAGDATVRVRRYERAADQSSLAGSPGLVARARSEAEGLAAAPLGLDEVIQASSKIAPKAVEAMLVETRATFNLNSGVLIRLQKAGVPAHVTDLMVAQSFPERFVVERQESAGSFYSYSASSPYSAAFASPYLFSPYGYSYDSYWFSPYGYAGYGYSPYQYSPFAYLYWSQPYVSFPSYRLVSPTGAGSTPATEGESGAGRAVAGRGYTRVRPRDGGGTAQGEQGTSSSGAGNSSTGSARSGTRSSGGSVSRDGYSNGSSSSGDSSSGGSSGGGSGSSGGSSSSGGRTAQPR
jgi:hypothetical protein